MIAWKFLKPFLPYILGLLLAGGILWAIHHHGYNSGKAEREAYYAPILKAAQDIATAQNARLQRQETDSQASTKAQEKDRAEKESTLAARAAAAERAYARILQDRAGRSACPDLPAPGSTPEPSVRSGELERAGEDAALARAIAESAVRDAQRLAECQSFYRRQRDILAR